MTLLGQFALWAAWLLGLWGIALAFSGRWQRRPELSRSVIRSAYAVCGCLLVASLALWKGLVAHDFNIEYVAAYTSRNLPPYYIFSAFWAGQKGSLLFWAVVLSIFASAAQFLTARRFAYLMPYVAGVTSAVITFFVSVMIFAANPFERLDFVPADGRGLNPQLQNVGMVIHPPMLYLGYISITIPFAFAVAALLSRRLDTGWIHAIRKWTLVSWLFLSIGITLGMRWAYVELGWGGYWAWDPVEKASLLPWLTVTAFLHSVMIQEKRGMLKRWNLGLIIGTFLLSIFGTFITRSGVIASVHSFTQSNVGYFFLAFLAVSGILAFTLLYTRWPSLRAEVQLDSMLSREAAFLFNNLLLVGVAFSVLWGTLFPILSELVKGTKITVGPPFFNRVNIPLGLLLLALTGIGPLIAWRRASVSNLRRQFAAPIGIGIGTAVLLFALGMRNWYALVAYLLCGFVSGTILQEFYKGVNARRTIHRESAITGFIHLVARNRRRYGGYIVHAGIVMLFAAFAGLAFRTEHDVTLRTGQEFATNDPYGHHWRFVSQGASTDKRANRMVTSVALETFRDGKPAGFIKSEKRQYFDSADRPTFEPSTEVGIRSTAKLDTYVVLAGVRGDVAELRVTFNPLVV